MPEGDRPLLDTHGPHLVDIGHALQHFLDPILFQSTHAVVQPGYQHFRDARMLLNILFQRVSGSQQFVQRDRPAYPVPLQSSQPTLVQMICLFSPRTLQPTAFDLPVGGFGILFEMFGCFSSSQYSINSVFSSSRLAGCGFCIYTAA